MLDNQTAEQRTFKSAGMLMKKSSKRKMDMLHYQDPNSQNVFFTLSHYFTKPCFYLRLRVFVTPLCRSYFPPAFEFEQLIVVDRVAGSGWWWWWFGTVTGCHGSDAVKGLVVDST